MFTVRWNLQLIKNSFMTFSYPHQSLMPAWSESKVDIGFSKECYKTYCEQCSNILEDTKI